MKRLIPFQGDPQFRQLWRVVDGAVRDTMHAHPDYWTERGRRMAEAALVKRITNSVRGYVEQRDKGLAGGALTFQAEGGSGFSSAAEDALEGHILPQDAGIAQFGCDADDGHPSTCRHTAVGSVEGLRP